MNGDVCAAQQRCGTRNMEVRSLLFIRGEEIFQLSRDHTDEILLRSRGITDRKPRLTQHLGIALEEMLIEPYIAKEELQAGDRYLLCSDGLTDMVSMQEISTIMQTKNNMKKCANHLIDKTLENGGIDNVTVIVFKTK